MSGDGSAVHAGRGPAAARSSLTEGMVSIPGGTFRMGSDEHYPEEAPAHNVRVDALLDGSRTP